MAAKNLQIKAISTLLQLLASMKNTQICPDVNPSIMRSIETLYSCLLEKVRREDPAFSAELERNKVLEGQVYNQEENEKIIIPYLFDLLQGLEIKDVSVDKNMGKDELHIVINLAPPSSPVELKEALLTDLAAETKMAQPQLCDQASMPVGKDQESISDIMIDENLIAENIADINKALNRLSEMEGTIESFFSEEQRELIKKSVRQVVQWLESENTVTPAYKSICLTLQKLIEDFIKYKLFAEANPVIDVFGKINTGILRKNEEIRQISMEVLQNLASEQNINILFNEIDINEKNKTTEAFQIFFGFGEMIMKKLLDSVRDANDSKERIRIIHIIQELGERAIPAIKESINMNAPWYYLRNMAYILGRIGNYSSADILRPLLLHNDRRVRIEALKSIHQIGGNKRGPLLLSVLQQVEHELAVNIIETLGKIKYYEAVPDLIDMLKSKSSLTKDEQIALQEKICSALGVIGSSEAIPVLTEIAESRSFLGIKAYPDDVKNAASRALAKIKRI